MKSTARRQRGRIALTPLSVFVNSNRLSTNRFERYGDAWFATWNVDGCLRVQRGDVLDGGLLTDDGVIAFRNVGSRQKRVPVDAGGERLQLRDAHRIVDLVDVAAFRGRPAGLRDAGLEFENRSGALRRFGVADHREHPLDIRTIGIELRFEIRIEIVVAVRQTEAGLSDEERVHGRVRRIGRDTDTEQRDAKRAARLTHVARERVPVADGRDLFEILLERLVVETLDRCFVHEAVIDAAELTVGGRLFDDVANLCLRAVEDVESHASRRLVGRDLRPRFPGAVHELIEVVTRLGVPIHACEIDAPGAKVLRDRRRPGGRRLGRDRHPRAIRGRGNADRQGDERR